MNNEQTTIKESAAEITRVFASGFRETFFETLFLG
jgi:hypothetical protein